MKRWLLGCLERLGLLSRPARTLFEQSASLAQALHGWLYARFTKPYVRMLIEPPRQSHPRAVRWLAERYHAKVLTPAHARAIVVNERILRRDLERVIPFRLARELVLEGPPDIAAYECACRAARPSPCQPTMVCLVVGQPVVDLVLRMHPRESRRLRREEALELLEQERLRGHMHTAWFKDAMLGRFYAICNCCKCCCGGIQAMKNSGVGILAPSGFVAVVEAALCQACGACVDACPFDALALQDGSVSVVWDRCMGCGVCEAACPCGAVRLVRDAGKGEPLDVSAL
ncbi:MAG: 4Fe-4S binding protein [Bryobacteraceae bacterium]|nr:4Fe-4S binding protein [Bryobacteraceae bacterium]